MRRLCEDRFADGGTARTLPLGARALALICAGYLAFAGTPARGDFGGRAALSYAGSEDSSGGESSAFRQNYRLVLSRPVSDIISYSLGLEYLEDVGRVVNPTASFPVRNRLLRPSVGALWRPADFIVALRYDYTYQGNLDPALDRTVRRDLQTGATSVIYNPSPDLTLRLAADRFVTYDAQTRLASSSDNGTAGVSWRFRQLRFTQDNRVSRFINGSGRAERISYGPRGDVQYEDQFGKRVTVLANYAVEYMRSEDSIRLRASGTVAVDGIPTSALGGRNEIPNDTAANPLLQNPLLIDRDVTTSAGVALGPDGASFWNIGVDMGRIVEGDEIRVHVRDRNGGVVPSGGLVSWTVYTSTDGQRWAPVTGEFQLFDATGSLYRITFPKVSSRYFKVVNFGTNTLDTNVTEIQISSLQQLSGSRTRYSSSLLQIVGCSTTAKLFDDMLVGYQGLANFTRSMAEQAVPLSLRDITHTVFTTLGPFGPFTTTLQHSRHDAQTSLVEDQSSVSYAGTLQYAPIPRFDAALTARTVTDEFSFLQTITRGAGLMSHLRLYDAFRLTAAIDATRQFVGDASRTDFLGGATSIDADVTRDLQLTGRVQLQHAVSTRGDDPAGLSAVPIARVVEYGTYSGEARYRMSPRLLLGTRLGWVESPAGSGLLQHYQARWSPLANSAVELATNYEQDVEPLSGRRFQRVTVYPRWRINRHATFDVNYNLVLNKEPTGDRRQQSLFVTLMLTM